MMKVLLILSMLLLLPAPAWCQLDEWTYSGSGGSVMHTYRPVATGPVKCEVTGWITDTVPVMVILQDRHGNIRPPGISLHWTCTATAGRYQVQPVIITVPARYTAVFAQAGGAAFKCHFQLWAQ